MKWSSANKLMKYYLFVTEELYSLKNPPEPFRRAMRLVFLPKEGNKSQRYQKHVILDYSGTYNLPYFLFKNWHFYFLMRGNVLRNKRCDASYGSKSQIKFRIEYGWRLIKIQVSF